VKTTAPTQVSDRPTGQSQDAIRHERDALHHKFHKGPEDQKASTQSQARAQQDSVDMQQLEGQQPEIPKIGSSDAPGG
jgi:hypothetical protein